MKVELELLRRMNKTELNELQMFLQNKLDIVTKEIIEQQKLTTYLGFYKTVDVKKINPENCDEPHIRNYKLIDSNNVYRLLNCELRRVSRFIRQSERRAK